MGSQNSCADSAACLKERSTPRSTDTRPTTAQSSKEGGFNER